MALSDFLVTEIFTFLLVFCRVGSAIMLMPGFGESYISPRVRLLFALMLTLVLSPTMTSFPAPPNSIPQLIFLILAEILVGLFIGTLARLILNAISTAGTIIAFQSSLASAVVPDVTGTGGQTTSVSNLLSITVLVLLFVLDMHHIMLRALMDSYQIFHVGNFPIIEDMTKLVTRTINESFSIAVRLASPHIVMGLVVYLAAGIIARLMPSFQVFFIMMPPNLMLSFALLMLAFNSLMLWYMDYFKENMMRFAGN